ncbi:MAG: CvpA family protein [Planctomycetaceae bacterium]
MIDILLLAIVAIVTWCVASEGAWTAGSILLSVLISGLLAMNFFEPVADFLGSNVLPAWENEWDMIALIGLFALLVTGLRFASEYLVPTFIPVSAKIYDPARWIFAGLTGYITMAFLLTALHTAPLPREFMGFTPERKNLFGITAPDREWLGFTQYVSEKSLRSSSPGRVFDGGTLNLGDSGTEKTLATFPIRYASRRDMISIGLGSGGSASSGSTGMQQRGTTAPAPEGKKGKTPF